MTTSITKVAFITGGTSGIGLATAEAFARNNFTVVIIGRNKSAGEAAQTQLGKIGECSFFDCDVTDDAAVQRVVKKTTDKYGRLDFVFNAVGTDGDLGIPLAESTLENWNHVIAVNLTSTFSCMRHQIPAMLQNGGGAIVNCASVAGLVGAPNLSAYVAAKHGIVGLTKSAALEYARQGIRINAVCPAMIDTSMSRTVMPNDMRQMMMDQSPIGRYGEASDVASLVLWLCGVWGSDFLTGQAIAIDGGWTAR